MLLVLSQSLVCTLMQQKQSFFLHSYCLQSFYVVNLKNETDKDIPTIGLLICALISENQGLLQTLEIFQVLQTWIFFLRLYKSQFILFQFFIMPIVCIQKEDKNLGKQQIQSYVIILFSNLTGIKMTQEKVYPIMFHFVHF